MLHDYQQETLRQELRDPVYADMAADIAYLHVTNGSVQKRLARTRYEGRGKNDPGFPNKVRRADFEILWNEVRG